MTTIVIAITGLALSAAAIYALCLGDPKRRRASGQGGGATSRVRTLLVVIACVPGLVCGLLGDSAALMLWLGGAALLGWLAAASLGERA
jgi:hypothetical protein